jgi:superfamily II DNA or RNA helicase
MPRTAALQKEPKRPPRPQGWLSTDEEEIERRRQRAAEEAFTIEAIEPEHPVLGTFRVASAGRGTYEVEIRSLTEQGDNSCGCPDYQVNGLGTCKHVEAVLSHLSSRRTPRAGALRIEVFLRRSGGAPEVRMQRPPISISAPVRSLLTPFFTASGRLRGDPVASLPEIARAVSGAPPEVRRWIRVSRHLLPWAEEQRRQAARQAARAQFVADAEAGRATFDVLHHPLYPYQKEGMLHLAFGERALLADEMGLGKTIQAIAACALLRRLRGIERVLVISPASLKTEWEEQIARFTDLPARIILGTRAERLRQYTEGAFFYLANYEQILNDGEEIQRRLAPDVIVLDEAQRIKNWQSRTAQAVKRLQSPYAFVLTGTPLENRIDEIYSIVQFLDPSLFGPLFRFNREFYQLDDRGKPVGYKNLDELHRRLSPVLLRRRKDEVEGQLPARTDKHYFVPMEAEQTARYSEYEDRVARLLAAARRRQLSPDEMKKLQKWLSCMRMICDTPYILDPECRVCPKLTELEEILREVLSDPGAKILIFSEWERMLDLVRELAQDMDIGFAWHTGSVPQAHRRGEIRRFKESPDCRLFLSTDSGGVGLNLQAANVVINLDLPWNPARLEQRIARAWRKHQTRPVQVIDLVTENSIEHRMIPLLAGKQALADGVLDGRGDLTDMPLPSGRKHLVQRLETLMGRGAATPAEPATPVRVQQQPATSRLATLGLDPAACDALQRLIESGVLQLTPEGQRLLGVSMPPDTGAERAARIARARELFEQAERKMRMAIVLAGGGFPIEALPALRESVETALRSQALLAGHESNGNEPVPLSWIESALPQQLPLLTALRGTPEAVLGAGEEEARQWITAGRGFVEEVRGELGKT